MTTAAIKRVRREDYAPPPFLVDQVALELDFRSGEVIVDSQLHLRRNPAAAPGQALQLDGYGLQTISLTLDGVPLSADRYTCSDTLLCIAEVADRLTLSTRTRIDADHNSSLSGLYRSQNGYFTQCEAQGFRRITWFPDRPDVMSTYSVTLHADREDLPVLLANGNPVGSGEHGDGRHWAKWHDPFPKPCYLFAVVAARLDVLRDDFVTADRRRVQLALYVEPGKSDQCAHALDALKRAMRWDEQIYGLTCDLDHYMIVAVSDFNMGAMENKGLNIFNDRYILATPDTATDQDYHNIEAIVAHEYFHNWTGNRITCRDWFQLCLKEGLTVFRDQEFSSDERSRPVERIANVLTLRAAQFVEDAGPLAHPVRPQQYKEINNFYTATVYNKGSEVIQMLRLIIGPAKFREGMDLYFERHDGEACTVEQFIRCFADVSGYDFTQFMRWYDQAGTPILTVNDSYEAATGRYTLHFSQTTKPTPGQPEKQPQVIPVKLGLIGEAGNELVSDDVVIVDRESVTKTYENIPQRPIPSLLRGFSAPVRLEMSRRDGDLLALAAHDPDPFNRWQALQDVEIDLLKRSVVAVRAGGAPLTDARLAGAIAELIRTSDADPAFAALAIGLPRETEMAREIAQDIDPDAIGTAVSGLWKYLGGQLGSMARETYERLASPVPFSPDARSAGRRVLSLRLLNYQIAADPAEGAALAFRQFQRADNMTDRANALWALLMAERPEREEALALAEKRFADDPLLMDLWFTLNASIPGRAGLARVEALMSHSKFTLLNPNRARALVGAFANGNPRGFHMADGAGYRLVVGAIGEIDGKNPQLAARLATAFRTWRGLEPARARLAEAALRELAGGKALSRDLADILERSLA